MLHKNYFYIIISLFLSLNVLAQGSKEATVSTDFGLNPADSLVGYVFFDRMMLKLPASCLRQGTPELEEVFETASFDSPAKLVTVSVKKKGGDRDLSVAKKVHESMAKSFYNGEIHRSEYLKLNNLKVYVFEMSGYWNGSKTKESWIKFFTVHKGDMYQCLIKFPEKDNKATEGYRKQILESLAFK